MDFIKGKPRSVISITSDSSYEDIMAAVYRNDLHHRHLRAVVQLCKANPDTVLCILYRARENGVLMIFGNKPECIRVDGTKLSDILSNKAVEGNIYLFTYVK